MLTKADVQKLVTGGLMAYSSQFQAVRKTSHKNEILLTQHELDILACVDAQLTKLQLEADMDAIWKQQLTRKQIAKKFGVTHAFVEKLIHDRKHN